MLLNHLLRSKKLCLAVLAVTLITLLAVTPRAAQAASDSVSVYMPMLTFSNSSVTAAGSEPGAVYVLTNQTTGNAVAVYNRSADGTLSLADTVATGGLGIGTSLGSQGAVILSEDGQWLFAVNAGSDEISVFSVQPDGLALTDRKSSGGDRPNSLAFHKGLLYVLNSGDTGNITGFILGNDGLLAPIPGSTRNLSSSAADAAQVSFTPDGNVLVVTEKATNRIDTYTVDKDGLASGPTVHPSAGATPFGFAFAGSTLVVSEAPGSAVSSYRVDEDEFAVITPSVANDQVAACWMAATKNGKYAYSANAGSSSVSAYGVGQDGSLTLLDKRAGLTGDGTGPVDMSMSHNSQYLYVLSARTQNVIGFAVQADGSLMPIGTFPGLPALGAAGIAAW